MNPKIIVAGTSLCIFVSASINFYFNKRLVSCITSKSAAQIVHRHDMASIRQELDSLGKKVVVVGGCFDILHIGHIRFLQQAKAAADIVVVLLESDENIRKLKGPERPFNSQVERAHVLAALRSADYIILLPPVMGSSDYDDIIHELKPSVIATTAHDQGIHHKKRQAKMVGAQLCAVIDRIPDKSTTHYIEHLLQ